MSDIEIVKEGTLKAFLHDLKYKTVKVQCQRQDGDVLFTLFGDYIYTFVPRWWYRPFVRFFNPPMAILYDSLRRKRIYK